MVISLDDSQLRLINLLKWRLNATLSLSLNICSCEFNLLIKSKMRRYVNIFFCQYVGNAKSYHLHIDLSDIHNGHSTIRNRHMKTRLQYYSVQFSDSDSLSHDVLYLCNLLLLTLSCLVFAVE